MAGVGGLVLVVGVAAATWRWWPQGSAGAGPIDSVAVLPFVNASGSQDADYLSEGVTETLTNSLAQIRALRVIPRTLAAKYKDKTIDPEQVGRELNVRAVVTGQIVQRGDRLRVQADLIDVANVAQFWGEQFDRPVSDALSMQAEISKSIAEKLRVRLTNEDERGMTAGTNDAAAYRLYLKGRYEWDRRSTEGFRRATDYFEQAIARDPTYAQAYVGLALVFGNRPVFFDLASGEASSKAITAARKALELDPQLAGAHVAVGYASLYFEWDWTKSEREFKRALELDANDSDARFLYAASYLRSVGRTDEAIAQLKQAAALDPLSLPTPMALGLALVQARRYDDAIDALKRALQAAPDYARAHDYLARAYRLKGMGDLAIAESRRQIELGDPAGRSSLAQSYAVAGRRAEATALLKEIGEEAKRSPQKVVLAVQAAAGLGDRDRAFAWLEQAYKERDLNLVFLNVQTDYDSLRADPRFADLVRRVGIPTGAQK